MLAKAPWCLGQHVAGAIITLSARVIMARRIYAVSKKTLMRIGIHTIIGG